MRFLLQSFLLWFIGSIYILIWYFTLSRRTGFLFGVVLQHFLVLIKARFCLVMIPSGIYKLATTFTLNPWECSVWSFKILGFIDEPAHFQMKTQANNHNLHVVPLVVSPDKTSGMFSEESCLQPGKLWAHVISPGNNSRKRKNVLLFSARTLLHK